MLFSCPDPRHLIRYVTERLSETTRAEVRGHLDGCAACAAAVREIAARRRRAERGGLRPPSESYQDAGDYEAAVEHGRRLWRELQPFGSDRRKQSDAVLDALGPGDVVGDVRLGEPLGRGGFGRVFLGQNLSFSRRIAVKIARTRSYEGAILSTLNHPHIVRVDHEQLDERTGLCLLYMQFAPGGSLHDLVRLVRGTPPHERSGRLLFESVDERLREHGLSVPDRARTAWLQSADWPTVACYLGARIADALRYAHEEAPSPIYHRDVKPKNVLMSAEGEPLLVDFNLSYGAAFQGDDDRLVGGTEAYMSPEQLAVSGLGEDPRQVDHRSDIYSMALVLWELLTGRRVFEQPDQGGWLAQHEARRAGLPWEQLSVEVAPNVRKMLAEATRFDASERPSSAGRLARQLEFATIPRVQGLLASQDSAFRGALARFPLLAMMSTAVPINFAISRIKSPYNSLITSETAALESLEPFVDPVLYAFATLVILTLVRTMLLALRHPQATDDAAERERIVDDAFRTGDRFWIVVLAVWSFSGALYPALLWQQGREVPSATFLNFLGSQILFGLLAASVTWLATTFLVVRVWGPTLTRYDASPTAVASLERVERQLGRFALLFLLAPAFLLVLLAVVVGAGAEAQGAAKWYLLLGGGLAWPLVLIALPPLRRAMEALRIVSLPTRALLYGEAQRSWR